MLNYTPWKADSPDILNMQSRGMLEITYLCVAILCSIELLEYSSIPVITVTHPNIHVFNLNLILKAVLSEAFYYKIPLV